MKNKKWIVICAVFTGLIVCGFGIKWNTDKMESIKEFNNHKEMKEEPKQSQIMLEVLFEKYYESWSNYDTEEMDYVDENTFQRLKEIYDGIEFYGEYKKGDKEVYDYYREKYAKVLSGEAKILYDDKTGYSVEEENDLEYYGYNMEQLEGADIYHFDMDGDGLPELCLDGYRTFVIKYYPDTDKYRIWGDIRYGASITGSKRICENYVGRYSLYYSYYQLEENSDKELYVSFGKERPEKGGEYSFFASLPEYEDETKEPKIQKELKKQIYGDSVPEKCKLRVTEKQYVELTEKYFGTKTCWRSETVHMSYFFPEMKRVYTSYYEFPDNMVYADEKTFERLRKIYEGIEFYGEFKKGDPDVYEEFREKYAELLSGRAAFTDDSGKQYKLEDYFEGLEEKLESIATKLYYFDIDEDNYPELYIQGTLGNYVFKYNPDNGRYYLWWESGSTGTITGKGKERYQYVCPSDSFYRFYQMVEEDMEDFSIEFGINETEEEREKIYMVSWPLYEDNTGKPKLTKEMKKQGCIIDHSWTNQYFYRLTKSQYEALTKRYFEADVLLLEERVPLSYFLGEE